MSSFQSHWFKLWTQERQKPFFLSCLFQRLKVLRCNLFVPFLILSLPLMALHRNQIFSRDSATSEKISCKFLSTSLLHRSHQFGQSSGLRLFLLTPVISLCHLWKARRAVWLRAKTSEDVTEDITNDAFILSRCTCISYKCASLHIWLRRTDDKTTRKFFSWWQHQAPRWPPTRQTQYSWSSFLAVLYKD